MADLPPLESLPASHLLCAADVAYYLGCDKSTVTEMISTGKMPGIRLPIRTGLRVRVDQLRKFIDDNVLPRDGGASDALRALRARPRRRKAS